MDLRLFIEYIPLIFTLLFFLIVGFGILFGALRGFRKSLILYINAIIAFSICVILFFVFVKNKEFDKFLLDTINMFLGSSHGLEDLLNVSDSTYLKEVLIEYIPLITNQDSIALLLRDNGAYLLTLVDLVYRLVFAIILMLVYQIFIFILYIIYLIFFKESRYKKKKEKKFSNKLSDRSYSKHRISGSIVGGIRTIISTSLAFSLIGSLCFILTGGSEDNVEKPALNNDSQIALDIYSAIEIYDDSGIYKVLNSIRNEKDLPYYMYACNIVFSGNLNDTVNNINEDVYFIEDFTNYTSFTKDTYKLLMKYGKDDLIYSMENGFTNIQDIILKIFDNKDFSSEFEQLILNFENSTYMINLTYSFMDSIIRNIDELDFMQGLDPFALDILKLLFKEGYHSQSLVEEQNELKELPCLSVREILTKSDIDLIYKVFLTLIQTNSNFNYTEDDYLNLINEILPNLTSLSLFNSTKNVSPVLGRLYTLIAHKFLMEEDVITDSYYSFITLEVDWKKELMDLISIVRNISDIGFTIYKAPDKNLDYFIDLFSPSNSDYQKYLLKYDEITHILSNSKLLGYVLKSSLIFDYIKQGLKTITPNMYFDENIEFTNKILNNEVVYGEIYHVFKGMRLLFEEENIVIIKKFTNTSEFNIDDLKLVADLLVKKDQTNNSLCDYLLESKLIESMISSFIIDNKNISPDFSIYVPTNALVKENVNVIQKDLIKDLFMNIPKLMDIIIPLVESGKLDDINSIINNDDLINMLNNPIIEGSLADCLRVYLTNEANIIISSRLQSSIDYWVTNETDGELKNLLKAIRKSNININDLLNGNTDKVLEVIKSLSDEEIKSFLKSEVLYYSLSNYLQTNTLNGIEIIIPNASLTELKDDVILNIVKKEELTDLLINLKLILNDTTSEGLMNTFINSYEEFFDNLIILTTFINYINNNEEFKNLVGNSLVIPETLKNQATKQMLIDFTQYNKWNLESRNLLRGLDELLNVSDLGYIDISNLENDIKNEIKYFNDLSNIDHRYTKLEIIYQSNILSASISNGLDNAFNTLIKEETKNLVKQNDAYKIDEIKALVNTINVFEIDVFNVDETSLKNKIMNEFNTFNDKLVDYNNKSTVELVFESVIMRSIFTDEINKQISSIVNIDDLRIVKDEYNTYIIEEIEALINSLNVLNIDINNDIDIASKIFDLNDENINVIYTSYILIYSINQELDNTLLTNSYINPNLLTNQLIKDDNGFKMYYKKNEIINLLNGIKELEINSLEEMNKIDFETLSTTINNESILFSGKTRLEVLYLSYVVRGIITKSIHDQILTNENQALQDHPFAYEASIEVYKMVEIESLANILEGRDISNFELETIKLSEIRPYIYEDGITKSYLLVSSVSKNIFDSPTIVVPENTLDQRVNILVITPKNLYELINSTILLGIDTVNVDINADDVRVPLLDSDIDKVLESDIMCAIITRNIVVSFNGSKINKSAYTYEENIIKAKDHNNNPVIILNELELKNLLIALKILNPDRKMKININLDEIKTKSTSDINTLLESSLIYIAISDSIIDLGLPILKDEVILFDLSIASRTFKKEVISVDLIKQIIRNI